MRKSLVALDTDHIKGYVFATDKLKEIRGASSILDRLNRQVMEEEAWRLDNTFHTIYVNGGSGLFLIDAEQAKTFGQNVQRAYRDKTAGGASITYVVQPLPDDAPEELEALLDHPLEKTLALMRHRLREAKGHPPDLLVLPSHPLMHTCDSCGVFYAEEDEDKDTNSDIRDPGERNQLYCLSCQKKRREDVSVKEYVDEVQEQPHATPDSRSPLWESIIFLLRNRKYPFPENALLQRPRDFHAFQDFRGSKEYMGIIYADANGMGRKFEQLPTLRAVQNFARETDEKIYTVVADAIVQYLRPEQHTKQDENKGGRGEPVFPFDILLMGGDDVIIVTPAAVAMQVALAIATAFYKAEQPGEKTAATRLGRALSVGVVLAPVNYPFGLLNDLASDALKFAKKDSAKAQTAKKSEFGDTRINFLVVTGSTSQSFNKVYDDALARKDKKSERSFYATLRPYTVEQLHILLQALQEGNTLALGRTKLHQLREAVLRKNLTTSVGDGLALLRNWNSKQRDFMLKQVYTLNSQHPLYQWNAENPAESFPRVTFPWFADGKEHDSAVYRTVLLDFIELYDFVAREEEERSDAVTAD